MDPQLSLTFCFPRCLLVRKGNDIETTVYGKPTHNDIYLHWNLFAPESCKRGTLKTLLLHTHIVCSNQYLLEKEIKHLRHVFAKVNGYPKRVGGKTYHSESSYGRFSNTI